MRTGIAIGGVATTINIGSTATGGASGNADTTPSTNGLIIIATPGTSTTQNQYSAISAYKVSSSTATAITCPASTVASAAISVGDFVFQIGTTTTQNPVLLTNTLYVGLSTAYAVTSVTASSDLGVLPTTPINVVSTTGFPATGRIFVDSSLGLQAVDYTSITGTTFAGCTGGLGTIDTTSTVFTVPTSTVMLAAEPTATGAYARVAVLNNPLNWPAATSASPALKSNANAITFPASTLAWSSGATPLTMALLCDAPSAGGGNIIAWAALTTPQTVNAAGITASFAAAALAWQLA